MQFDSGIMVFTPYICTDGTLVGARIFRCHTLKEQTVFLYKLGRPSEVVVLRVHIAFTFPDNAKFFVDVELPKERHPLTSLSNKMKVTDRQDETNDLSSIYRSLNLAAFMSESLKWITDLVPCHWEEIHAVEIKIWTLQWDIFITVCNNLFLTLGCVMQQQQLR